MIKEQENREVAIEESGRRVINVAGKHLPYNFLIAAILFTERLSEPLFIFVEILSCD